MDPLNVREKLKALRYHVACAQQYRDFARDCTLERLCVKPSQHAAWHDLQAQRLVRELGAEAHA